MASVAHPLLPPEATAVVAVDHTRLLLATVKELVCLPVRDPRSVVWRLPLPASPLTVRPNPGDRDLVETSIALAGERIYLRAGAKLWCFA